MIEKEIENTENMAYKAVKDDSLIFTHELLSPAGDTESMYAAIAAGADAVYAAADRFGARAYAANFSIDDYIKALKYAHLFDRKIYLTLNTLIKEREFSQLFDLLKPLYEAGLDGVIVQDLGVIAFVKRNFPNLAIHASTQLSVNTEYGVRELKKMGVCRVVLSRELSLEEIERIHDKTGMELECFIHGAMCFSYSGQCLMSSFYGGRSGNRGRCAGTCRLPYRMGPGKDSYLLSMKDLCCIDILDRLLRAGIKSFKIEGRMKSPAYVAGVTSIYRKGIDKYLADPVGYRTDPNDRKKLLSLYSRQGSSEGYYERKNSLSMITLDKGGYQRQDKEGDVPERLRLKTEAVCRVFKGEKISIRLSAKGREVECFGAAADEAKNRALRPEDIAKQVKKTGDSFFEISDPYVLTDGESFVPVSSLNELRRKGLEELLERLDDGNKRSL